MAMTELALLFIGALATLATVGMFMDFRDLWTPVIVSFAAAMLWGLFGMSSFDVIVRDTSFAEASEPILPLVWLGFGFAFATGMFWLWQLKNALAGEVGAEDAPGVLDEP